MGQSGQARVSRTRSFRSIQERSDPRGPRHDGGGCSWGVAPGVPAGSSGLPSLPPERGRRRERGGRKGGAGSTQFRRAHPLEGVGSAQPGSCSSNRSQRSRGTDDGEGQSSDKVQTPFLTLSHYKVNGRALQQKLPYKARIPLQPPRKANAISSLQKMELGEVK